MTDIATIRNGYHWFRHHEDGGAFVDYAQDGLWYMPGLAIGVLPKIVESNATYLHPVEAPAVGGLN